MFSSCKKSSEDRTNEDESAVTSQHENKDENEHELSDEEKAITPKDVLSSDDMDTATTIELIDEAFEEGKIEAAVYHTSKVQSALVYGLSDMNENLITREGNTVDLSKDAQWLIDNYEGLDSDGKSLVEKMITFTETDDNITSSLLDGLALNVHAGGLIVDDPVFYPREISENVWITTLTPNVELSLEKESTVVNAYLDNEDIANFLNLVESKYKIVISAFAMPPHVDSMSFLSANPAVLGFDGESTFHIQVNILKDNDVIIASIIHELFHCYQYELGYTRATETEEFLMESTAIWAIKHQVPDNDYPIQYDDHILFSGIDFEISDMDAETMKSWYQLPYMIIDQYDTDDFMYAYLTGGLTSATIPEALEFAIEDKGALHDTYARFGQMMFGDTHTVDLLIPEEAPYAYEKIDDDQYTFEDFLDMAEREPGKSMGEINLSDAGYYPIVCMLDEFDNAKIDIMSALSDEENHQNTGMIVFIHEDDQWRLVMDGEYLDFMSYIDLKDAPASELLLVFFSYSPVDTNHKYALNIQERISGEGSIDINIKTTYTPDDADSNTVISTSEYNLYITENIELLSQEGGASNANAMPQFVLGDVYYIKDFQAILDGVSQVEKADGTSDVYGYSGQFNYKDGDPLSTSNGDSLFAIDLESFFTSPSPGDGSPGSNTSLDLNGLLDSLGDLGTLPEMEGLADELNGLESDLVGAQDEMAALNEELGGNALGIFSLGAGKLNRFKEIMAQETFHFYPEMPNGLISSEWVDVTRIRKYYDEDNRLVSETTDSTSLLTFDPIPLWFVNPYYDEDEALEAAELLQENFDPDLFLEEFSSTDAVADQIIIMNGLMDKHNLFNAFNEGSSTFELNEDSGSKEGVQVQELKYDETTDVLTATITAIYDEFGTEYEVTIEMRYAFN